LFDGARLKLNVVAIALSDELMLEAEEERTHQNLTGNGET